MRRLSTTNYLLSRPTLISKQSLKFQILFLTNTNGVYDWLRTPTNELWSLNSFLIHHRRTQWNMVVKNIYSLEAARSAFSNSCLSCLRLCDTIWAVEVKEKLQFGRRQWKWLAVRFQAQDGKLNKTTGFQSKHQLILIYGTVPISWQIRL